MSAARVDHTEALQDRLRAALRDAMRARRIRETRVIRLLIAAIDDAQAVPVGDLHERYAVRAFGDASTEVPPLSLGEVELDAVLAREIANRREAADELSARGRAEEAAGLEEEIEIVRRFVETPL